MISLLRFTNFLCEKAHPEKLQRTICDISFSFSTLCGLSLKFSLFSRLNVCVVRDSGFDDIVNLLSLKEHLWLCFITRLFSKASNLHDSNLQTYLVLPLWATAMCLFKSIIFLIFSLHPSRVQVPSRFFRLFSLLFSFWLWVSVLPCKPFSVWVSVCLRKSFCVIDPKLQLVTLHLNLITPSCFDSTCCRNSVGLYDLYVQPSSIQNLVLGLGLTSEWLLRMCLAKLYFLGF